MPPEPLLDASPPEDQQDTQAPIEPVKDPTAEALEATRRAVEQAEAWSRLAATQAIRNAQPQPASPQPFEYPAAPEDLDPALEAYIEGRIQETLRQTTGHLYDAYMQDRKQDLTYRASLEQERASRKFSRFTELDPEVRAYLSGLPLETQAAPGAYDEAYYAVLGRKAEAEAQTRARSAAPLSGSARSPVSSGPAPFSPEEAALAADLGITEADLSVYGGRFVSISSVPAGVR